MKGGFNAKGFTIVETLIVLAVSGTMLVAVISMISGQQGKSQFQQAINNVTQQLQQSIDDVANGYYPTSNIVCTSVGGAPSIISGNSSLGSNDACVLVGKVIQFDSYTDPINQRFIAYPLVDLRINANASSRTAIAPGASSHTTVPDNSVKTSLDGGLTIVYSAPNGTTTGTVGFGLIMGNASNTGIGADVSGSQSISLYIVSGTKSTNSPASNVDIIDTSSNYVPATSGFNICLASGTTNQSGLISIGSGTGRKLSVTLTILDGKSC